MAKSRASLSEKFHDILGDSLENEKRVYFQPPESVKLKYPCIIYTFADVAVRYADNHVYKYDKAYEVTYITQDPDDTTVDTILTSFEMCRLNRPYKADNLNHYKFTIYY